jgi:hypothetical protein
MRQLILGMFVALGLLTACSSSSTSADVPAATTTPVASGTTASPGSSSTPTPSAPASYAATGTATDSQGDKATVSVRLGTPVPQLSLNQAELTACSSMDNITDGANQTMAIPVQITVTLMSSIATNVIVGIDGTHVVAPGGNANSNPNLSTPWVTYSSDSACSSASGQDGLLEWNNLAPNRPVTWSGWELDPEVITPDDPSGSAVNQVFFLEPMVNFGSGNAPFTVDAVHSHNLLTCAAGVEGGPIIAVDPRVVLSNGCTKYIRR